MSHSTTYHVNFVPRVRTGNRRRPLVAWLALGLALLAFLGFAVTHLGASASRCPHRRSAGSPTADETSDRTCHPAGIFLADGSRDNPRCRGLGDGPAIAVTAARKRPAADARIHRRS